MFWVIELMLGDSGPYITRCLSFDDSVKAEEIRRRWGEQNDVGDKIAIVRVYLS